MAVPDDVDALYRPLGGVEGWSGVPVKSAVWDQDVLRLRRLGHQEPALADMVGRGCLLAAAYQSGALATAHGGDRDLTLALISGAGSLATVAAREPDHPDAPEHLRANYDALCLAHTAPADPAFPSPAWVQRVHAVACGPQQVHPVHTEAGWQDHVLAHGDYKHHANHQRTEEGGWRAFAPVAELDREMGRLGETLSSDAFNRLHPVAQAACALHAIVHIGPFAVGNGRAGRALASAFLLRAGGLPLVVFADEARAYTDALDSAEAGDASALVGLVEGHCANTAALVAAAASSPDARALESWRRQVQAAHGLHAMLPAAVDGALGRHRRRQDLRWRSDLTDAVVLPMSAPASHERFDEPPLTVRVPAGGSSAVEDVLLIDAHPLSVDDRGVVVRAEQAALELDVPPAELLDGPGDVAARLEPWLDRVMMSLAVRVAAELE